MLRTLFTLCASLITAFLIAQPRFVNPVEGEYGKDFIIVNYVDWGAGGTVNDNHCLSKAYDGHQGTDFVLPSFRKMDSGVNVVAVDTGVVIFTHDGEFDREKVSVISKGLGNYVGLTHSGNLQTYYGHLMKNSIVVSVGDTVYPGQVIGKVASSGNSTDPHLHFELWYDSTYYIDPFEGPCGNASTYWLNPYPFDSSFNIWTTSMWNGLPFLDTLREAPFRVDTFDTTDTYITYWSLMYGLRAGDSLLVEWRTPTDSLWTDFGFELTYDWWYYYYYSYLDFNDSMPSGDWTVLLKRNGVSVDTGSFHIADMSADTNQNDTSTGFDQMLRSKPTFWSSGKHVYSDIDVPTQYTVYSTLGHVLGQGYTSKSTPVDVTGIAYGVYILSVRLENGRVHNQKIVLSKY